MRGNGNTRRVLLIFCLLGVIPVCWFALLIAPFSTAGLTGIILGMSAAMAAPFSIRLCKNSLRAVALCLMIYIMGIGIAASSQKNYRRREEHGSAQWGEVAVINRKYEDKQWINNKIMTMHFKISYNQRMHLHNLLTIVIGGSGAGKTRFFAKVNLMMCNTSFVVLDPKGELLRDTGMLLKEEDYEIMALDLINMEKSHCYNPFVYLKTENDVQRLVTNLFKSTPLDDLFHALELRKPEHIALKYYRSYHSGSAKTLKSIQVTLTARLEKFNLSAVAGLTATDELNLSNLGEKKTALFAVIPDNDTSFNFLVSILYTQLFQQLFSLATNKYGGKLPVHVHFLMDEFANGTQLYR